MRVEESMQQLNDQGLLDKVYGFAYKRCSNSYDAEDLCSEIIVTLLRSLSKNSEITNFHAFVWTVAHRVYADFATRRKREHDRFGSYEEALDCNVGIHTNSIEDYMEMEEDRQNLKRIKREIAFLSKKHREVMILYYLDQMKVCAIAKQLNLSETAVKQRLFSARKIVKGEVEKMDTTDLVLKPIRLNYYGYGVRQGNDPTINAYRTLAQNIVYYCKDKPRTIKEISEHLHIPTCFLEEEVEAQCYGQSGQYGLLKRLDSGKYIANILMLEKERLSEIEQMYMPYVSELAIKLRKYVDVHKDEIVECLTVGGDKSTSFLTWPILMYIMDQYKMMLIEGVKEKYLRDIQVSKQPYKQSGIVIKHDQVDDMNMYGIDGIRGQGISGYEEIYMFNIYGRKISAHFRSGHNISLDPLLLMIIQAINGLDKTRLSEKEKEVVAEAIEKNYLEVRDGMIYPKILIVTRQDMGRLMQILEGFKKEMAQMCDAVVDTTYKAMMQYVPKHLIEDYNMFIRLVTINMDGNMVDYCIDQGILSEPEEGWCAEGIAMIIS